MTVGPGLHVVTLDLAEGLQLVRNVAASRTRLGVDQSLLSDAGLWWCENGRLVEEVLHDYAKHLGDARRLLLEVQDFFAGPTSPTVERVAETYGQLAGFEARFPVPPANLGRRR